MASVSEEEINEILNELHEVNIEHLENKAKKLFYAIMKIADERDELKQQINNAIEFINEHAFIDESMPNCNALSQKNIKELKSILNEYKGVDD